MRTEHSTSGGVTPGRTTPNARDRTAPGTIDSTVPGTHGSTVPNTPERQPWPPTIFERVACVRALLQAHPEQAFSPAEIARRFTGARQPQVQSILETFEMMGIVRELEDGRYCV